jgi:hypothetical protein
MEEIFWKMFIEYLLCFKCYSIWFHMYRLIKFSNNSIMDVFVFSQFSDKEIEAKKGRMSKATGNK